MSEDESKEIAKRRHFTFRLNIFFFATFMLFSVLVVNLAILQFVEGKDHAASENRISSMSTKIAPIRGNIYDANGYPIAYSFSTQTLFYRIEPNQKTAQYIEIAKKLADMLKKIQADPSSNKGCKALLTPEEIIKLMDVGIDLQGEPTKKPSYYSVPRSIRSDLCQGEIAYLMSHLDELPGFEINEESVRMYDDKQVAPQLVGFLRPYVAVQNNKNSPYYGKETDYLPNEYVGLDGIELMYQDALRGQNGEKSYPINAEQKIIGNVTIKKPVKGQNLFLTINKDIQLEAQKAIEDNINFMKTDEARLQKFPFMGKEAVAGYAVAMEVDTGRVVAMANFPNYDPNIWHGGLSDEQYRGIEYKYTNGTIRERYADLQDRAQHPSSLVPLGSTVKPLSVLLGLNEGLFGPYERYMDTGSVTFGKDNTTIRNSDSHAYGSLTAESALKNSSNVFMIEMVGLRLYGLAAKGKDPIQVWDSYMKQFGLGVPTGSGLPYENPGDIYYLSKETLQSRLAYASFGQQARYTTLQLAQYCAMLASKGKRMKPLLVDSIRDTDNNIVQQFQPEILNQVNIPDEYWNVVQRGMESGVEGFNDFPYKLVRKTGTSQQNVGRKIIDNAVFIGYAPADNPKLAVAVVVPEGGFGRYGAAPIARKIFDAYDKAYGLAKK